jgi:NAD(P) transhydrogenase subunit alpha
MRMKVGVLKETTPGEHRVALVPEMVARLRGAGLDVLVQSGAGDGAWFADSAYAEAGASIVSRSELLADADIVVGISAPDEPRCGRARPWSAC